MTVIKTLNAGRSVIFDQGKFDNWCVYVVETSGSKKAPFDNEYFGDLKKISTHYQDNKVYNDFISIYDLTTHLIEERVLDLIDSIVKTYNSEHQDIIEQWFSVIYAGMIAEENKQYAILKKRIKRLGVHQVLMENMSAYDASRFSYGKKWRDLDSIMRPLGF